MADSHSEPEKYSLDEMMERLSKPSNSSEIEEAGELVTRADGTQAMKVRKRKRRSEQPKKAAAVRTRKIRIIQVTALLVVLVLLGLGAAGLFVYSNSAPFRNSLVEKVSQSTGATTDVVQFRVTPTGVNANQVNLKWPEGSFFENLVLTRVKADISPSSYFGSTWTGKEAEAVQGDLVMELPDASLIKDPPSQSKDQLEARFDRLSINQLNVVFNHADSKRIQLSGAEMSYYQNLKTGSPELRINKGLLNVADWPSFRVDRSSIGLNGREVDIQFLRLRSQSDDRGNIEFSGKVLPYSPDARNELSVKLDTYRISDLMGSMSFLLLGKVDTRDVKDSNVFRFNASEEPKVELEVAFASSLTSTLGMERFPFLHQLSRRFDDPWFQHPIFGTKAIGILRRQAKKVALTNLDLEHRGKLAVSGDLEADLNEILTGTLEVGVSPTLITNSGDARLDAIFSPVRDGFRWITLTASGTASDPNDDFASLYENATVDLSETSQPAGAEGKAPEMEEAPALNTDDMWERLTH